MSKIIYRAVLIVVFITVLLSIIAFARGYRLNLSKKTLDSTGILVASSYPDGAKILIDGDLHGATNSNIALPPGTYSLKIEKDGFSAWKKELTIKGELVIKADALLFPQNPSLSPITALGVVQAFTSPDHDSVIVLTQNTSEEKDGVYLLETSRGPLSITNPLRLLVQKTAFLQEFDFDDVDITFSPTDKEILLDIYDPATERIIASYLIDTDKTESTPFTVTQSRNNITDAWDTQRAENLAKQLETFDKPLPKLAQDSFDIIGISANSEKILYVAKQDAAIPLIIDPPLIATNQTPQVRDIKQGNLYVYDAEEDKNYEIKDLEKPLNSELSRQKGEQTIFNSIFWYPDSMHVVIKEDKQISVVDYDGTNRRAVYSGPFEQNFVTVSSDGKLVVLANLNPQSNDLPDAYAVGIR
ncbi:MAG: PEGA domain-containing protein [Candidatus Paceibacterota bacterium]